MRLRHHISIAGIILAIIHLAFAAFNYMQQYEEGWEYFPIAVVDFPVTLLMRVISNFYADFSSWWFAYFVLGSIWWYTVGALIASLIAKRR